MRQRLICLKDNDSMKEDIGKIEKKVQRLFRTACADYRLLEDGDRVLVALSGGKDSLELLRLLGGQQKILKPKIEVEAIHVVMDNVPYVTDKEYLQATCDELGVKLHIVHTSFEEREESKKPRCFMCSWNRRKAIFTFASDGGFNKVALGHHQDDVIVTYLMNIFYEGAIQTMPPALKMKFYPVTIIRPMCLIPEEYVKRIAENYKFKEQIRKCPYEQQTKRTEMAELFKKMERNNPEVRYSLWGSMKNINREMLP